MNFREIVNSIEDHYNQYKVKKSNGKWREICAPKPELKLIQKQFYKCIYPYIDKRLPKNIKGFRKGESIADNARFHLNKEIVVNIDIENFFPSIPTDWIHNFIKEIYLTSRIKRFKKDNKLQGILPGEIFQLITLNGKLPQGSPCSPILANYYLTDINFDICTEDYTNLMGWDYSRYADDLTFSTNKKELRKDVKLFIKTIYSGLKNVRLKPSWHKTKIRYKDQKQLVTGIIVNGKEPRIPADSYKRIRASIHKNGLNEQNKGYLAFIKSINQKQLTKMVNKL